jgi:hypothetical protein
MAAIPTSPAPLLNPKYLHYLGSEQFCNPEKVIKSNLAVADANLYQLKNNLNSSISYVACNVNCKLHCCLFDTINLREYRRGNQK